MSYLSVSAQIDTMIVDCNGHGDYRSVSEAIDHLPMFNYERITIIIKNGVYNEKFRIEQDYITLQGENRDSTIIKFSQLREDWIKNKDSIGPAVVNIHADDVILQNMTIINTQPEIGPHAFTIYGTGTRTIITDCNVISKGGDTVSLWDYKTGMYYHSNCYFEGAVDFVCPRGWCFIRDSKFFEVKSTAAIWHAGGEDESQKFVLKNCSFDGVEGFELGRHHYDAQFILIDCEFSANMSDRQIYRVTYPDDPSRDRPFNWGPRYFYSNPKKEGIQFSWLKDNFAVNYSWPAVPEITPLWTFNEEWDPESTEGPKLISHFFKDNILLIHFSEDITVTGKPKISIAGKIFEYRDGRGTDTLRFELLTPSNDGLSGEAVISDGKLSGTIATVLTREVVLTF